MKLRRNLLNRIHLSIQDFFLKNEIYLIDGLDFTFVTKTLFTTNYM